MTAEAEVLARVSGRLRHRAVARVDFPAVGDWVAVEPAAKGGDARILAVLPRRSRFSRRAAGDVTEEQVVAANIDTVFLVAGLDGDFNPRRIERYLLVASESGAAPVIVLNKADVVADAEEMAAGVRAAAPGVPVHAVSCRVPGSLDVLRQYLGHGETGALLGSSGVGKSTIVNRLIGHDLLRTHDVRESDSRGRHTSTARQLVLLPGVRGADRHAGDARAPALGHRRRRWAARSTTSTRSPRRAGSATAGTCRSPGARFVRRSTRGRYRAAASRATTSCRRSRRTRPVSSISAR